MAKAATVSEGAASDALKEIATAIEGGDYSSSEAKETGMTIAYMKTLVML